MIFVNLSSQPDMTLNSSSRLGLPRNNIHNMYQQTPNTLSTERARCGRMLLTYMNTCLEVYTEAKYQGTYLANLRSLLDDGSLKTWIMLI